VPALPTAFISTVNKYECGDGKPGTGISKKIYPGMRSGRISSQTGHAKPVVLRCNTRESGEPAGEQRIIITTIYRVNYLAALKAISK